ncbi:P2Y purinoceptor 14-like [Chanos chanos]|uniref:P2Y purinoceptor 14-like n=1 Tax=Chanos chanos TaxID=29144 RepID=A0A6J2VRQ6_CHACN|nr:P2Y purinoceptor 14-like [Chanos chanos]
MRVYFCKPQRHHSSVTIYLKNLAASDFFLSLCLPLRVANYGSQSVLMRHVYCNFGATAFYLNMYASILFMDYIAANRYMKIVRPLETHALQTVRAARYISVATWVFLLAPASAYLVLSISSSWGTVPSPGCIGCEMLHSPLTSLLYKVIHTSSAVVFLFVLISLVLLYRGTARRIQQAQRSSQAKPGCKKLNKSKRNMQVLVVVFCICFVPYHLVRLPYAFLKPSIHHCTWLQAFYTIKEVTVLLSVLNACLDPLIYFIFCKAFRAQLGLQKPDVLSTPRTSVVPELIRRASRTSATVMRRESVF